MNTVTVSNCRRPWATRQSLEALCRAWRWRDNHWADIIWVCLPFGMSDVINKVAIEAFGVRDRNQDVPLRVVMEPSTVIDPHHAAKWMLDMAFQQGSDCNLYVEDDVVLAPDGFLLVEWMKLRTTLHADHGVIGCCLYHETVPEYYPADRPPNPRLLHLTNGINTCGGTAFLREPYLRLLAPRWNCKMVEPRGFDYSAHFLMYLHKLYMLHPDYSRSHNIGRTGGGLSEAQWDAHFGRSITIDESNALSRWEDFEFDGIYPPVVREPWMEAEIDYIRNTRNGFD
jgi:hypothetical protein